MNKLVNCLLVNDKDIPDLMNRHELKEFWGWFHHFALFHDPGTRKPFIIGVMSHLFSLFIESSFTNDCERLEWPGDAAEIAVRTAGALPTLHGPVVGGTSCNR